MPTIIQMYALKFLYANDGKIFCLLMSENQRIYVLIECDIFVSLEEQCSDRKYMVMLSVRRTYRTFSKSVNLAQ